MAVAGLDLLVLVSCPNAMKSMPKRMSRGRMSFLRDRDFRVFVIFARFRFMKKTPH